jgi:pSer/pThr/pTyr-binding forkhead associated (FHA) protein
MQYYNENGEIVRISNNAYRLDDKTTILNIECLTPTELAKKCGLYTYQPPASQQKNGKPARPGKLVIDKKTGTCTHKLVELSDEEIAQQQEDQLRAEFEAWKAEKKESEFEAWKAEKKGKKQ